MDATCYESYVRFPTDPKLLWECCQWVFEKQLFKKCKTIGHKKARSKYREQKAKQLGYFRKRRKSFKETLKRKKIPGLPVGKGLGQLQEILDFYQGAGLKPNDFACLKTIKKVLVQQQFVGKSSLRT
ncbi:hypothetical protein QWY93_19435 [Echinicola jeungdonensis]|uniref:hypothetical protein n=1 Tax=Echinicola jeungdonensis TaxID=709343 RepID=UPI0025B5FDEE|nr:hypothetical protein [Echinicola jeungdonensis]MDN3671428.1 hypothetical protein [Echinicola jeungdonensis]